jgi:hypothetical protein
MIKQNEIKVLLMANVQGGNLHHPDTEAIKGRCIRTNFHHYILKCQTQEREALMFIINENCKNFSLLNIDAKLVWLLNNENIDILINEKLI